MKMIIAVLLSFALLAGITPVYAAKTDDYYQQGMMLEDVGILPLGFCDSTEPFITRGEFAELVVKMAGYDEIVDSISTEQYYFDVPADHPEAGFISMATKLGYFSGNENSLFYPDANITYAEALKVALAVIGYDKMADKGLGYPAAYIQLAAQYGLLKGIAYSPSKAITRVHMIALADVLANLDVVTHSGITGDDEQYTMTKGATLISEYHHVYETNGKVTANRYTSLDEAKKIEAGYLMIDNETYKIPSEMEYVSDYLGYYVTAYYKLDGSDKILVHCTLYNNSTITIMAKDIVEFKDNKLTYYANGREKNASLARSAAVIFNNSVVTSYEPSIFIPVSGSVTLIESKGTGGYNIAIIKSYENHVVQGLLDQDGLLITKYAPAQQYDLTDSSTQYIIKTTDGVPADISIVKEWDIISVAKGDKVTEMIISKKVVNGSITSVDNTDPARVIVSIGNEAYTVSQAYAQSGVKSLSTGDNGIFYLNTFGEIVTAKLVKNNDWQYAYIVNADTNTNLSSTFAMKLFTAKSEMLVFDVAEKVTIDGERKSASDALLRLKTNTVGTNISQLISYKINIDNIVTDIDTMYIGANESKESSLSRDAQGESLYYQWGVKRFYWGDGDILSDPKNINTVCNGIRLEENTPIFFVPYEDADRLDETQYSVRYVDSIAEDTPYDYVYAFDIDEAKGDVPGAVVIRMDDANVNVRDGDIGYVENITDVVLPDGTVSKEIHLISGNGNKVTLIAESADVVTNADIARFDIVQYVKNTKGRATQMLCIFRPGDGSEGLIYTDGVDIGNVNSSFMLLYGVITDKYDEYLRFLPRIPSSDETGLKGNISYRILPDRKIVLANLVSNTTRTISYNELGAYLFNINKNVHVFIHSSYQDIAMMVIYKDAE